MAKLSLEDRVAIEERLGRYAWALDTGSIEGVAACFTPDGVAIDTQGNRSPALEFAHDFITRPDFRGRQHQITHLFFEGDADHCIVTSYWTVFRSQFKADKKEVASVGYSRDTLVKRNGNWLISERALYWLTDEHGPWFGPKTP